MNQRIQEILNMDHHLTPREIVRKGGSPNSQDTVTDEDWRRPVGKRLGYNDEEIRTAREIQQVVLSPLVLGYALSVYGTAGFRLMSPDESGLISDDPPIIEADLDEGGQIIAVRDREDLRPDWIKYLKEKGLDLNLQPVRDMGEGPQSRSGELSKLF